MKFIHLFGRWYVARKHRRGRKVNERGEVTLRFKDIPPDVEVCVDGHRCRASEEGFVIRAEDGAHEISIMGPDGTIEEVEDIVIEGGMVKPQGFDTECFLIELAERVQRLEAAEKEDREKIQHYYDRKTGKLFLGGTKQ